MLEDVLEFWFLESTKPLWFQKNSVFDNEIKDKFLALYEETKANYDVENIALNNLALVILFDQFPRNMFRDSYRSFEMDNEALEIAKFSVENHLNEELSQEQCSFLYMPFMHSEDISDQDESVRLFAELGDKGGVDYAIRHQEIIQKFGRFPHRNHVLGRKSTEKEQQFLLTPNSSF